MEFITGIDCKVEYQCNSSYEPTKKKLFDYLNRLKKFISHNSILINDKNCQ